MSTQQPVDGGPADGPARRCDDGIEGFFRGFFGPDTRALSPSEKRLAAELHEQWLRSQPARRGGSR